MHTDSFDFETLRDREAAASAKWVRRTDAEKAAGIVPMSVADMEFLCAPALMRAVEKAAAFGLYGYTDPDARYRKAVADWMRRRHGFQVDSDWIVPQGGVVPSVSVAVRAFTEPGDGILLCSPAYYPFEMMIEMNGRVTVRSLLVLGDDDLYRMDFDDLREKAARPDVKMMILCSPHNPVGRIWTRDELRTLAGICLENDVLLLSDEIHCDLELYGKHTVLLDAAPEIADHAVLLTAPSKTFNIAGLQAANTIIPSAALREKQDARRLADGASNVSYFGYHAAIAAYNECEPWLDALLPYLRGNFEYFGRWFEENLPQVRMLPVEGTYLAWTDWRKLGMDDPALERFVRGDAMLVLDEGTMFGPGGEGFMRFNLALPRAELERAMDRLKRAAALRGIA